MSVGKLLGIITLVFMGLTMISGLRRWKLAHHRKLAFMTLILALVHAFYILSRSF